MSKGDIKWWFEPGNGQKWGWLLPVDIGIYLDGIYGAKSPITIFAREIGVSASTVTRWRAGHVPMPKLPALYLHQRWGRFKRLADQKPLDSKWLPECRSANGAMACNITPEMLRTAADADRAALEAIRHSGIYDAKSVTPDENTPPMFD